MNRFLQRTSLFLLINLVIVLSLIISSHYYAKANFNYSIPPSKNILIIGNSYSQTSFYENKFLNAANISIAGQLSFWSMIKLDDFIDNNPHIDTVIFSYSTKHYYESIYNLSQMKYPIKNHSFFMKYQDFKILLKHNFISSIKYMPNTIIYNFIYGTKYFKKSWQDFGGFAMLKGTNVEEHKKKTLLEGEIVPGYNLSVERIFSDPFLHSINAICDERGLKLVLVIPPFTKFFSNWLVKIGHKNSEMIDLINNSFENITFLDYSSYQLPDEYFYDLDHLNQLGSKLLTEKFLNDLNSKNE